MIAQIVASITENLNDLIRVHERMLDLTQQQTRALAARQPQRVFELLQEIEVAMIDRTKAEARRSDLITQAAQVAGVPADNVTVQLLAQLGGIQAGSALEQAAARLKPIVASLAEVVSKNRASIEYELGMLDHMVKGITTRRDVRPAYSRTGATVDVPRMKILDAQV